MEDNIRVLYSEEQTMKRIVELSDEISRTHAGKSVHLIGILQGSVFFMCELARHLTIPATMDFISCHSYSGTESTGSLTFSKTLDHPIKGRDVIVIEDIVDTGNTLSILMPMLREQEPARLELAALLDKPSRRLHPEITIDYLGFSIDDLFVVGFGLDYEQKYRNLPYIGVKE